MLGASGKMGPTLARMARRALDEAASSYRVIAVSRFSSGTAERSLGDSHVETIRCDLADRHAVSCLPDAPNVIFMAGQKFGTSGSPATTWGMNTIVPAIVAERYARARIVAFSTGNVYPLTSVAAGGSRESDPLGPTGDYAMSCVGRERVLEYLSVRQGTPVAIVRLNYAVDLRYGVLVDIARKVFHGEPVDLRMGHANVIWQGDANARAIECLAHAASPPFIINITGPETLSIRETATRFGELFGKPARLEGVESSDALLSNAGRSIALLGAPTVSLDQLVHMVAGWLIGGGRLLGKPTHFETRDGAF
ncbi:MAG: NAD(P)-dependent oxidoreductase [Gemmatimonadota bacterium]|nr:NAD(P)-dependent oxidoreductase [Gemmatimonadota bacterium]